MDTVLVYASVAAIYDRTLGSEAYMNIIIQQKIDNAKL